MWTYWRNLPINQSKNNITIDSFPLIFSAMRKKYAKEQLQEVIANINKIVENRIGSFALRLMKLRQTMLGKDWNYT